MVATLEILEVCIVPLCSPATQRCNLQLSSFLMSLLKKVRSLPHSSSTGIACCAKKSLTFYLLRTKQFGSVKLNQKMSFFGFEIDFFLAFQYQFGLKLEF